MDTVVIGKLCVGGTLRIVVFDILTSELIDFKYVIKAFTLLPIIFGIDFRTRSR